MKIAAIVEARMSSTRLPGKVLLKANNRPMLEHLIDRLKSVKLIDSIIIATTANKSDDVICDLAKKKKVFYFRGSELNVLERVIDTVNFYNPEIIVQITGDCPIVDPNIIDQVIRIYLENKCDYVGNSHIRSYPDGMDVQVFSKKNILKSFSIANRSLEFEHVTLNMRMNPKIFKPLYVIAPKNIYWPELGLTLDEKEDYILLKKIIEYFPKKYLFTCLEVINLLNKNKKWIKINRHIKRKGDN
jgi:spore coat polysaccharide biosynthesis protein SpsF